MVKKTQRVFDSVTDPWEQVKRKKIKRAKRAQKEIKYRIVDIAEEQNDQKSTKILKHTLSYMKGKGYYDDSENWHKGNGNLDVEGF